MVKHTEKMLCVYWIKSGPKRYIGKTTNGAQHRLKQHNGEIVGGAKTTKLEPGQKPWVIKRVVTGFRGDTEALRFEHALKFEFNKHERVGGKNEAQRMLALEHTIAQPCWEGKLTYV
jgi:predicted GIY-YIG superfamily endonuclease